MTLANGTPIVAKKVFGRRFSFPLDAGTIFFDGRPLFGPSKTIRGAFGPASQHRQISICVAKLLRQTPISKLGLKNNLLRLHT